MIIFRHLCARSSRANLQVAVRDLIFGRPASPSCIHPIAEPSGSSQQPDRWSLSGVLHSYVLGFSRLWLTRSVLHQSFGRKITIATGNGAAASAPANVTRLSGSALRLSPRSYAPIRVHAGGHKAHHERPIVAGLGVGFLHPLAEFAAIRRIINTRSSCQDCSSPFSAGRVVLWALGGFVLAATGRA